MGTERRYVSLLCEEDTVLSRINTELRIVPGVSLRGYFYMLSRAKRPTTRYLTSTISQENGQAEP